MWRLKMEEWIVSKNQYNNNLILFLIIVFLFFSLEMSNEDTDER